MRVRELARHLGIDWRALLGKLSETALEVVADNAMSQLTPAEVELVCAHLGYPAIDEALAQSLGLPKHRGSEVFGELRSVLAKPPSEEVFVELCDWLGAREADPAAVDYARRRLESWPSYIDRRAPELWIAMLLEHGDCPTIALCNSITIDNEDLSPAALQHLGRCRDVGALRTLHLRHCQINKRRLSFLCASEVMRLHELDLSGNHLGKLGLLDLMRSALAEDLRHLHIGESYIEPEHFRHVELKASKLEVLDLTGNDCSDNLDAVVDHPIATELRELHLKWASLWDDGAEAIARSRHLGQLEVLDLSGNEITSEGVGVLAGSDVLSQLTTLDLSGNDIGLRGVQALAASPHLAKLETLRLGQNHSWGHPRDVLVEAIGTELRNAVQLSSLGSVSFNGRSIDLDRL